MGKELRIIFLGTPDFAAESLRQLVESGVTVVAVVTAPDKPKGRGQKTRVFCRKGIRIGSQSPNPTANQSQI